MIRRLVAELAVVLGVPMADEFITLLSTEGRAVVDSHIGATPVSLEVVVRLPSTTALGRDDDDPVSCT